MLELVFAIGLLVAPVDHGHAAGGEHHQVGEDVRSTVAGDVRSVDRTTRTALIRHEAMNELSMPPMVMNFVIADDVDMAIFTPGTALMITVTNGENGFEIVAAEADPGAHSEH
jgi:Cu/Ag efflux protein CusF